LNGSLSLPVRLSGEKFILKFSLRKGARLTGVSVDLVALKGRKIRAR
jgi:hypothetical protein